MVVAVEPLSLNTVAIISATALKRCLDWYFSKYLRLVTRVSMEYNSMFNIFRNFINEGLIYMLCIMSQLSSRLSPWVVAMLTPSTNKHTLTAPNRCSVRSFRTHHAIRTLWVYLLRTPLIYVVSPLELEISFPPGNIGFRNCSSERHCRYKRAPVTRRDS